MLNLKLVATIISLLLLSTKVIQATEPDDRVLFGGFGIGIGIFYPQDINQYIEDQTSQYIFSYGFAGMISNYYGRASLNYRPIGLLEISAFVELGWAPKFILINSEDFYYYSFTRFSPGLAPKVHIPFGTGRHSFFIAPGITYNFLVFKEHQDNSFESKTNCLGWRVQVGFHLDLKKINIQPYAGLNFAKGTAYGFTLSYTSSLLGIDLVF